MLAATEARPHRSHGEESTREYKRDIDQRKFWILDEGKRETIFQYGGGNRGVYVVVSFAPGWEPHRGV